MNSVCVPRTLGACSVLTSCVSIKGGVMTRTLLIGFLVSLLSLASADVASAAQLFVIRHTVADYAKWRPIFNSDKPNQEAAGLTNPRVYHTLTDPNDITIVFDMADAAKAKAFSAAKRLKTKMAEAGVVEKPRFTFLETAP